MVNDSGSQRMLNLYFLVVAFFAASLAFGDYAIRFYVYVLRVQEPSQIIAGFTEPVTTKLVPALAVVYVHQRYDVSLDNLQSRPYWFAFVGGASLGVFERILYVVQMGVSINLGFLLAAGIHVLNALLIAGLIFSSTGRLHEYRFLGKLLGVTIIAMMIHVFWNALGVYLVYQIF